MRDSLGRSLTWLSSIQMRPLPAPRINKTPIEPFTQEEVQRMLKACVTSREVRLSNRRSSTMRLRFSQRDQAIILTLIETGLRAMELCKLLIGNIDLKTGRVEVKHGVEGGAKGGKGRMVYLGKVARRAVWRHLAEREDGENPNAPLFTVAGDRKFKPDSLRLLIKRIAERAGVNNAYPHKFRHTFAITICALAAISSPCSLCSVTARWKWCTTTPRSPRSILPRHITKPARQITGGCENLISI
jgi:integrase/recombinase XerD